MESWCCLESSENVNVVTRSRCEPWCVPSVNFGVERIRDLSPAD